MRDPDGPLLKDLPLELRSLLTYAQTLDFEAEPDYERIETILTLIKEKNGLGDDLNLPKSPSKTTPKHSPIVHDASPLNSNSLF
jgi:hypothetical protein